MHITALSGFFSMLNNIGKNQARALNVFQAMLIAAKLRVKGGNYGR